MAPFYVILALVSLSDLRASAATATATTDDVMSDAMSDHTVSDERAVSACMGPCKCAFAPSFFAIMCCDPNITLLGNEIADKIGTTMLAACLVTMLVLARADLPAWVGAARKMWTGLPLLRPALVGEVMLSFPLQWLLLGATTGLTLVFIHELEILQNVRHSHSFSMRAFALQPACRSSACRWWR